MIPILYSHDYQSLPIGFLDEDGKIKFIETAGITVQQLIDAEIGYIARKTKKGKHGETIVLEAELLEISLVVKQ